MCFITYLFVSKLSKILEAGIAPLTGVLYLMMQTLVNLAPALFVDEVAHLVVPDVMVRLNSNHTTVVVELQRLPQRRCRSRAHGETTTADSQDTSLYYHRYVRGLCDTG